MAHDQSGSIDLIYEAAFVPENWGKVLDGMARAVGAEGTVLFNSRAASTRWFASDGIMDLINRIVAEDWTSRNPRAAHLLAAQHHGFLDEADAFSEDEYRSLPIYTELMQPCGYGFGAATVIFAPSGDNLVFSVEKKRAKGPVGREGIAHLDALRPHLARAAMMASRLEFERIHAAVQALSMAGLPAAVLGEDGQVLAVNDQLEVFGAQIVLAARDRLRFQNADAQKQLEAALTRHRSGETTTSRGSRSFPLPRLEEAPPAVVHLLPVRGNARDIFARATFFVIVTPIDTNSVPTAELIAGLFDLSPAEARIARTLATGATISGTAARLGLSPETVRTHIKAIFAKTGYSRQADLLAVLARVPSLP
ncbi:MAG: hypothetical protein ABS35_33780 [Kaistia sp. SCN 65-12]|nr:MAG: hypothetical protein ABS35_33780 [Kaistia sp. SCN 65-12]